MKKTNPALSITGLVAAMCLAACTPAQAPAPEATTPAPAAAAADPAPSATSPAPAPVEPAAAPTTTTVVGADFPLARDACLAAVSKQANVAQDKLVVTEVLWAQAGVGVTVQVPDADAPWSCLSDEKGNVQGAAYTGSEGKL